MEHTTIKEYHFYAAHRNQKLKGKCESLHGHTYTVFIEVRNPKDEQRGLGYSFEQIDKRIEPIIKDFDHALLIDENDPLYQTLKNHHPDFKMVRFEESTSVENVCEMLARAISKTGLNLVSVTVQETKSSKCKLQL